MVAIASGLCVTLAGRSDITLKTSRGTDHPGKSAAAESRCQAPCPTAYATGWPLRFATALQVSRARGTAKTTTASARPA
eukprot:scaffold115202_cov69-Phaeocystis_antarctica.AAC.2